MGKVVELLKQYNDRLGLDIDNASRIHILRVYFNTRYAFPNKKIRLYRSSNRKGYHIEVEGIKSNLTLRRMLCDCPYRSHFLDIRGFSKEHELEFVTGNPIVDDVLFTAKSYNVSKENIGLQKILTREEIDERNLIAQDW